MDAKTLRAAGTNKKDLGAEIATRSADPNFFASLAYLPNPDHVLRRLGREQDVFDEILADAHVQGEMGSIYGGLLGQEHKLVAGGEEPADLLALELCQWVLDRAPAPDMEWADTWWNMAMARFKGYAVHELVWQQHEQYLLPHAILDRDNRRFLFSPENELRIKTRAQPTDGEETSGYKWLMARHRPSQVNPYGVALLSSCFWPWTFKTNGWRYFVKFCERYGLPSPVGKYPQGTPKEQQDELADALSQLIEDNVAVIPDNGTVELFESSHSGEIVQERLVAASNAEMSKALNSQTLASEIKNQGSRAAAETHREREEAAQDPLTGMVQSTMNRMFAWITEINVPGAKPPTSHFYEEEEARKDWMEVLKEARSFMRIPAAFAHQRLQIPLPKDGEDVLPATAVVAPPDFTTAEFSRPVASSIEFTGEPAKLDLLVGKFPAAARKLLGEVATLEEFAAGLDSVFDNLSDEKLGDFLAGAVADGYFGGAVEVDAGPEADATVGASQ